MSMSDTLQHVNAPYTIIRANETYPLNTGVIYRNEPMWVVRDDSIVFDCLKATIIPTKITANEINFKCNIPVVQNFGREELKIVIHDIHRSVIAEAPLRLKPYGRFVASVLLKSLSNATEYKLFYTIQLKSMDDPILKNIPIKPVRTLPLDIVFLPPSTHVVTNGEFSFNIRSNHDDLAEIIKDVSVSPFGKLTSITIHRGLGEGVFKVSGRLSELHHKTSIRFTIVTSGDRFVDDSTYKCLTCVESLEIDFKSGFEEITCWSRTNYTQQVKYFVELYLDDHLIESIESQKLSHTFESLNPDAFYNVRAWVEDDFGQVSTQFVGTIHTRACKITHTNIQFSHPTILSFGSKATRIHFTANAIFDTVSLCFKTTDGIVIFHWHNVPFTRNDTIYLLDVQSIELTCENILVDCACDTELYIQGTTMSGKMVEQTTKTRFTFDNDRTPPCGDIVLREIACASLYASFVFTAFIDHKRVPSTYTFTATLESPAINYKPTNARDVALNERFDFQPLLPDTPYNIRVRVTTVATESECDMYPLSFRTLVDQEYIVVHCNIQSTFTCTATFESRNSERMVVRLSGVKTYIVKRGGVVQLNFKPGKSLLLHTSSNNNHYVLSMRDGIHKKQTRCVFEGVQYEDDKLIYNPLMAETISF